MASIANLIVSMIADTASFNTDMERTSKQQAARMKKLEKEAVAAGKAIAAGFAVAAAATTAVVANTLRAADAMVDLSRKTGIGTEALSSYQVIADLADVSLEQFVKGINKMQRSISDASEGLTTQQRAFDRLGISVSDILQLSPERQFEMIARAIASLDSATLRSATAMEIFGRAGADMLPIFSDFGEAVPEIIEEMNRFGAVISEEFAAKADQFDKNMKLLGIRGTGLANTFTEALVPAILDIQQAMLDLPPATDTAAAAGEKLGSILKTLAGAFIIAKETALLFGRVLLATVIGGFNAFRAVASPITGLILSIADAMKQLAAGNFEGALDAIKNVPGKIAAEFEAAAREVATARGFLLEQFNDEIPAALARLNKFFDTTANVAKPVVKAWGDMESQAKDTAKGIGALEKAAEGFTKKAKENRDQVEKHVKAFEAFEDRLQSLKDAADPIGAMVREFADNQNFLNIALAKGRITAEEYQRILNALSDDLGRAAASTLPVAENFDVMREALLEGVRILERTFTDLWSNILDGSQSAFSGMLDGFKTLLAQMLHAMLTTPLIKAMQKAFEPGGGGFKAIDIKSVGTALAGIAGVTIGQILGGGGVGAGIGSALGSIIGKAALSSIPVIGTIVGGIIGGLLGGLFDKSKKLVLEASGFNNSPGGSDDDAFVSSIFGDTFIRSRRVDAAAINEFKASLKDFDNAIGSFLDDSQIANVSAALKDWVQKIEGETLNAEEILNSRFAAILDTFSDDIQAFVRKAQGLEEQVARLQVGVGAERLFTAQPDIFGEHTVNEFLAVVEAFKTGTESITDAFAEVVQILDGVVSAKKALQDFSASDLGSDFAELLRLQSESVLETLSRLTSDFADALNAFDGSPQQLTEIGNLALSIRQQELTALSLIDSVAKGLNANLDRLLADTKATIQGPRAAEAILFDARALIAAVAQASTPEQIAKIGADFEALIRSLSPEDTKRFGTSTLAIIEAFKAASNTALEQAKQAVIDSGAAIREMAGNFAAMIDPLALIASTNERAALALEALAGGDAVQGAVANSETIAETFREGLADQSQVLADGTAQMSSALASGVSSMAVQLANAIRTGFAGANVQVNVVVQDPSLVTQ